MAFTEPITETLPVRHFKGGAYELIDTPRVEPTWTQFNSESGEGLVQGRREVLGEAPQSQVCGG